jgi:D-3-phosphoglycerate dehydrogenase
MKVLITDQISAHAMARLKSQKDYLVSTSKNFIPTAEEMVGVKALLIRSKTAIDSKFLEIAPDLKIVISMTTGFDHIDIEACREKKIQLMHTPWANVPSTVELTWGLILALHRNIIRGDKQTRKGEWKKDFPRGHLLKDRTLGIIGLGRIGSGVAKIANAFGMRVIAFDPYLEDHEFKDKNVERVGFHELLKMAQVISLHVPYTRETHRLIDKSALEWMSPKTYLINTCRGEVVAQSDMLDGMDAGIIAGAALDVFETEPIFPSPTLRVRENLIFSPHVGAFTEEAFELASKMGVDKLLAFAEKGETSDVLPPPETWYQTGMSFKVRRFD